MNLGTTGGVLVLSLSLEYLSRKGFKSRVVEFFSLSLTQLYVVEKFPRPVLINRFETTILYCDPFLGTVWRGYFVLSRLQQTTSINIEIN